MNNPYLYEVSCYDCMNCHYKNYKGSYCNSACEKCYVMYPQVFGQSINPLSRAFNPYVMWYNPSQFPYGHYYGSYQSGGIMY